MKCGEGPRNTVITLKMKLSAAGQIRQNYLRISRIISPPPNTRKLNKIFSKLFVLNMSE
jgi:hypothetical protein